MLSMRRRGINWFMTIWIVTNVMTMPVIMNICIGRLVFFVTIGTELPQFYDDVFFITRSLQNMICDGIPPVLAKSATSGKTITTSSEWWPDSVDIWNIWVRREGVVYVYILGLSSIIVEDFDEMVVRCPEVELLMLFADIIRARLVFFFSCLSFVSLFPFLLLILALSWSRVLPIGLIVF